MFLIYIKMFFYLREVFFSQPEVSLMSRIMIDIENWVTIEPRGVALDTHHRHL